MPVSEAMRLTCALLRPDTAAAAVEALRGATGRAEIEGLVELIHANRGGRETTAAIAALEDCDASIVVDALRAALDSPHATVRLVAAQALRRRRATHDGPLAPAVVAALAAVLRRDGSWPVRRATLEALADAPGPDRWRVLDAADDPHWRVRHALLNVLLQWAETVAVRGEIEERLAGRPDDSRTIGVREYLRYRWTDRVPATIPEPAVDPARECPFWDWDPAVLLRNLDRMGKQGRRAAIDAMPFLLGHADERARGVAAETLEAWGEARHLSRALTVLDDPRTGAAEAVEKLFAELDLDRMEEVAEILAQSTVVTPAQRTWLTSQAGEVRASDEDASAWAHSRLKGVAADPDLHLRLAAAARLVQQTEPWAVELLTRLRADPHPHVRAAALTPSDAAALVADPSRETSWHVLAKAARMAKVPLWKLEPQPPWRPQRPPAAPAEPLTLPRSTTPHVRLLGPERLPVCPLGVSGHYGLPVEGFVRAFEAGVNLVFWEPNYRTLTEFVGRLSAADRTDVHVVAGTFEADGERVRRDAERALRALKLERLSLFLIFWVQSWARIPDDVREALERLKAAGKVAAFGLSTHNRPLALEAMAAGWNPVMVRHSAAHRGAEQHIFPNAAAGDVSLLTFNSTCYGRLLEPRGGLPPVRPSDCYRYTLMQPAVRCYWTAPATLEELAENLDVLRDPTLPPDRLRLLLAQGDLLYREETTFRRLVRGL